MVTAGAGLREASAVGLALSGPPGEPDRVRPTIRIASVDVIRGAVMVLMAIDHVRVYSGLPAGGPDPGIFFTRWITHFCAPAFIFLAGSSAFLYARTHTDVSRFLLTRGVWLILLELTVLRIAWTFNADFMRYNMAGVIWVIGCCMVLMALLVRLPVTAVGAFGVAVIAGHNLLDPVLFSPAAGESALAGLWKILYFASTWFAAVKARRTDWWLRYL